MDCYAKLVQGSLSDRKDAIFKVWETHKCMLSMATCWGSTEDPLLIHEAFLHVVMWRKEWASLCSLFYKGPVSARVGSALMTSSLPLSPLSPEVSLGEKISTWRFWEVKHTCTIVSKSRKENKYINVDKTKSQSSGGRCHVFWLPSPCDCLSCVCWHPLPGNTISPSLKPESYQSWILRLGIVTNSLPCK